MHLHEFMCPTVFPHNPNILDLLRETPSYPSSLLMLLDPENEKIYINKKVLDVSNFISAEDFGSYKPYRNFAIFKSLYGQIKRSIVSDMEDCRQFTSDVYLQSEINIFQYNRRFGNKSAVLWRLPNYFEPSYKLGAVDGREIVDEISFRDKTPKIFWRGEMSGSRWLNPYIRVGAHGIKTLDGLRNNEKYFSRIKAVYMSLENPAFTDIRFSGKHALTLYRSDKSELIAPKAHPTEALKYKYLLCLPGNDVSTSLYWIIKTNSVAFREDCDFEVVPDYFLKPWIHYVPISRGLDDMQEKFEYCESNPDLCLKIIDHAKIAYLKMTDKTIWSEAENVVLDRLGLL